MRISDVLAVLGPDFPALTPSKLRFLEERGLVEPRRTAGGYRQYSPADVERVRYVLREQRDRYLPLKVIADQLAALDSGRADEHLTPRLAAEQGAGGRRHRSTAAVAREAGVPEDVVVSLVEAGVLVPDAAGHLDAWAIEVAASAAALAEHGVEARHLRPARQAAERQADLIGRVVAPVRGQRSGLGRVQAATTAAELGELFVRLHTALLRGTIARGG